MARKAGQLISRGVRTWLVRVSLGRDPETGTRKYHNRTVHGSFRDAQTYLNFKLRERDIGRLPRAAAIRLDDYLDQWLATSAKPRLRPKSYVDYEGLLRLHIRPSLGARPIGAITQFDSEFSAGLRRSGVVHRGAPATYRKLTDHCRECTILRARNKAETEAAQSRIPVPTVTEIRRAFERNRDQQTTHHSVIRMPMTPR